jgi:hypothetical protein
MVYRDLSECRVNEKEVHTMPRNNSVSPSGSKTSVKMVEVLECVKNMLGSESELSKASAAAWTVA